MSQWKNKKIIFVLSGSIAAFKAPVLISALIKAGAQVKTVTTANALEFIGAATLEGLSGEKNLCEMYEEGQMMNHIHLTRWADAVIVYPTSAHLMAQWAHGFCGDLPSALFLARPKSLPIYLAPAMNQAMWQNSVTQKNVQGLLEQGVELLGPAVGLQACGEEGLGRLLEPEDALNQLEAIFLERRSPKGRVLITYGGTTEPIDQVRSIGNISTGRTGQSVCEELARRGWHLVALKARSAPAACGVQKVAEFESTLDLEALIKKHLSEESFDWVVQMAAVSDYSVEAVRGEDGAVLSSVGKLSGEGGITLHLKKTKKILPVIKSYSQNPQVRVVGFKLTVNATEGEVFSKVQALFDGGGVDLVVQNDVKQIGQDKHGFAIFNKDGQIERGENKLQMALQLDQLMSRLQTPVLQRDVEVSV
jgi:phosphopantothenoylcysteine decarboxylase/phosphopantothenate--cysteine ligase